MRGAAPRSSPATSNRSATDPTLDDEIRVLGAAGLRDAFTALGVPPTDPSRYTFSAAHPHRAIDRVYVDSSTRVLSAEVLRTTAARTGSDHLPSVVDVELNAG